MEGSKLHPSTSGWGHVAGTYEHGNKNPCYTKHDKFLDHLRSCKEIAMISEDKSLCQTNHDKRFAIAWPETAVAEGRARSCTI